MLSSNNEHQKSEALFELAAILGQQNDFQETLRLICSKARVLFEAEATSITMINPRTQNTIKTFLKEGKEVDLQRYQLVQTSIVGLVLREKQPFLSSDIKIDSRFRKNFFDDIPVRSVMCVPMQSEGVVIGCLLVLNNDRNREYDDTVLHLFRKMAAICSPFLSNTQRTQEYFNTPISEGVLLNKYKALGLLGKSQQFIELLRAIEAATQSDVRVLLEGRTGTGKELIARGIHHFSVRNDQSFVAIDCGAIPHHLVESELFGYKKGAFTGANYDRKGLIEEANKGTLFIDEIANLTLEMQSKLMRILQQGEVRPLGSNKTIQVDVRVITASSSSLRDMVKSGKFREDLFFRLHVYPIYIPDLNERREDIALLANHFLKEFSRKQNKKCTSFHVEVINFMRQRNWVGNIRELENFVERLVTVIPQESTVISANSFHADLLVELNHFRAEYSSQSSGKSLREQVRDLEAHIIRETLIACNWNQSQAARKLQTSEKNIRYKIQVLNIKKPVSE